MHDYFQQKLNGINGNGSLVPDGITDESLAPITNTDIPDGGAVEYADAECACWHCVPVRGNTIIGTRGHATDAPTIVHMQQCPYTQHAINDAKSDHNCDEVISDPANDRKLLLADCSVIASKNSEILKTGSSASAEHCILEFLVRVTDLHELQVLMDKLSEVHSVMSVERRVGCVIFLLAN